MSNVVMKKNPFENNGVVLKKKPFDFPTLREELNAHVKHLQSLEGMDYEFEFAVFYERLTPLAKHTINQYYNKDVFKNEYFKLDDADLLQATLLGECLLTALKTWDEDRGAFLDFWHLICKRHIYKVIKSKFDEFNRKRNHEGGSEEALNSYVEKVFTYENSEMCAIISDVFTDLTPQEVDILIALQKDTEERRESLKAAFGSGEYGAAQRKRVERIRKKFISKLQERGVSMRDLEAYMSA